ncbi:hypothetical protein Y1Q_0011937 [Alligator mississippiensis]|uniref:Uncharacterized protein n=1 Tax=Alligator mississippiensis TaxID=8496 RepID=A0A151NCG6_ALLMI|nr:hypothetical protein Y1Q_0011937 [Alligator mississippiensis]
MSGTNISRGTSEVTDFYDRALGLDLNQKVAESRAFFIQNFSRIEACCSSEHAVLNTPSAYTGTAMLL